MKLDYAILWVDDQPKEVKAEEDALKTKLQRLGFNLKVDLIDKFGNIDEQIKSISKNNIYDLILMDSKLGAVGKVCITGAEIAKKFRSQHILTDIIFYSSSSPDELRQLIFNEKVDGVFCYHRNTLVQSTHTFIKNSIRKTLDINGMRGMTVEAVSEFDAILNEIFFNILEKFEDSSSQDLLNKILNKIEEIANTNIKKVNKIRESSPIDNSIVINHKAFSSSLKGDILHGILKNYSSTDSVYYLCETLKQYSEDVIRPRNKMAHAIVEQNEQGQLVIKADDEVFDDNRFNVLRSKLLTHRDNFEDIKKLISSGELDELLK